MKTFLSNGKRKDRGKGKKLKLSIVVIFFANKQDTFLFRFQSGQHCVFIKIMECGFFKLMQKDFTKLMQKCIFFHLLMQYTNTILFYQETNGILFSIINDKWWGCSGALVVGDDKLVDAQVSGCQGCLFGCHPSCFRSGTVHHSPRDATLHCLVLWARKT